MISAAIALPEKLIPVFDGPADVRGAYGGRGSGKTRSFAKMAAVQGYIYGNANISGIILCARQFMNSLDDSSLEEVKRAIEDEPFLAEWYDVGEKYIKSKCGRISFAFAGLDRSIASVKSKGRILLCWVDEAEPVSQSAFTVLIPTLREEGDGWNAELWVTWNPCRKSAAVERFRNSDDSLIKVAELNWRDNPKFPEKLERDRLRDLAERPDEYGHIWEGDFATVVTGAYYAKQLTAARQEGRIGLVGIDPLMTIRLFCDIGGTGARADAFAMWCAQFIGKSIRAINHYESVGQPIGAHLAWLREQKYTPDTAQIWLPHDGNTHDRVYDTSYAKAFKDAGYEVTVVPNQGAGAAKGRVEAGRRVFPSIWFHEPKVQPGLEAVGWYHEKQDSIRGIGLGPEHDWSSHCFTEDTLVQTDQGSIRFDSLPPTGLVLTPCGYRQYQNPRMTRKDAPLVEVVFSDGHTVKCTPDHLFATDQGWKSAQSLARGSLILSTSTRLRSISTAAFIGLGQMKNTLAVAANGFTAMSGLLPLALSRAAVISTIETETRLTTTSTTWSAWMLGSTLAFLGGKAGKRHKPSIFQPWRGIVPEIGMARQKEFYGTSDMLKDRNSGRKTSVSSVNALTVERGIWALSALRRLRKSIAAQRASVVRIVKAERQTHMPLRIESVRHLSQKADVWDLTVPGIECFALANGAIVHNSADAFGLMAIVAEQHLQIDHVPAWRAALQNRQNRISAQAA